MLLVLSGFEGIEIVDCIYQETKEAVGEEEVTEEEWLENFWKHALTI